MLLSAVSFLVVAQSNSEIPEGLMNNPVYALVMWRVQRKFQTDFQVCRAINDAIKVALIL